MTEGMKRKSHRWDVSNSRFAKFLLSVSLSCIIWQTSQTSWELWNCNVLVTFCSGTWILSERLMFDNFHRYCSNPNQVSFHDRAHLPLWIVESGTPENKQNKKSPPWTKCEGTSFFLSYTPVPPILYYWTVPLILDHSYLDGKLTNSKVSDTKVSGF